MASKRIHRFRALALVSSATFALFLTPFIRTRARLHCSRVRSSYTRYDERTDHWNGCHPNVDAAVTSSMIKAFLETLCAMEAPYFVMLGSLLALERNQTVFPNDVDKDFDVFLDHGAFTKLKQDSRLRFRLYSQGYLVFQDTHIFHDSPTWANLRVCVNKFHPFLARRQRINDSMREPYYDSYRFIDVWAYKRKANETHLDILAFSEHQLMRGLDRESSYNGQYSRYLSAMPITNFFPLGRKDIDITYYSIFRRKKRTQISISVPHQSEQVLDALYPEWRYSVVQSKHGS